VNNILGMFKEEEEEEAENPEIFISFKAGFFSRAF
jgi:hypothetical protein